MNAAEAHSTPYAEAVSSIRAAHADRVRRFEEIRPTWDRFYGLSEKVGPERATSALPEDARTITEFEMSAPDTTAERLHVSDCLNRSLEMRMKELASASVQRTDMSIIGRLRQDLNELEGYRKESLDGIGGSFWDVVRQGHGVDPKEKERMINRILTAWCKVYEIRPAVMHRAALPFSALPDHEVSDFRGYMVSFAAFAKDYPFDLAADLSEATTWSEINPDLVGALVNHLEQHGDLAELAPSRAARF